MIRHQSCPNCRKPHSEFDLKAFKKKNNPNSEDNDDEEEENE